MIKCKQPRSVAEEIILSAALDMLNITLRESSKKIISAVPLSINTIIRRIHYMYTGEKYNGRVVQMEVLDHAQAMPSPQHLRERHAPPLEHFGSGSRG